MIRESDRALTTMASPPPLARRWLRLRTCFAALLVVGTLSAPLFSLTVARKKQIARTQFETAERMREALNGRPASQRKERDYKRVIDAYRKVYFTAPTSSKADASVVAVAELLAEEGRQLNNDATLKDSIAQYEFLRKEYPGSKSRVEALYTIAQIYRDDLSDNDKARATLQEFLKRYAHSQLADDARDTLKEMDDEAAEAAKPKAAPTKNAKAKDTDKDTGKVDARKTDSTKPDSKAAATKAEIAKADIHTNEVSNTDVRSTDLRSNDLRNNDTRTPDVEEHRSDRPLVTGVRHWSTPDYTRIAIDLEQDVQYDSGRIPNPDRIYFDLKDTRLSSVLKGKIFDVDDGFLKKIRVAQFIPGRTRVVLEVGDDVGDYSAFLLPNPYRLVIDIHGKKSAKQMMRTPPPLYTEVPSPSKSTEVVSSKKDAAPSSRAADKKQDTIAAAIEQKEIPKPVEQKQAAAKKDNPVKTNKDSDTDDDTPKTDSAKADSKNVIVAKAAPPVPVFRDTKPPDAKSADSKATRNKKHQAADKSDVHEARPTTDGERSLIRALGLKIGRIVVDAGHGGHDTGTIGPNGLEEKDLVLDVALRLGKLLEDRIGADVVYTRDDDTFIPLETRTAIANQQQADLFISVHANSSHDQSARGVETYYLNFTSSRDALEVAARENAVSEKSIHELQDLVKKIALKDKIEESREFALDVQDSLHGGLAAKTPAIRDRGVKKAPFIVLIGANMPSILAEISFISNPTDEKKLQTQDYRQKIAESLYKGVAKYVGGLSGVKVAQKLPKEEGQ